MTNLRIPDKFRGDFNAVVRRLPIYSDGSKRKPKREFDYVANYNDSRQNPQLSHSNAEIVYSFNGIDFTAFEPVLESCLEKAEDRVKDRDYFFQMLQAELDKTGETAKCTQ